MLRDKMNVILGVFWLAMGFMTMLSGHVVFGGIIALIGFAILYLMGRGGQSSRNLYEKQVKCDMEIGRLYEKLKDMDTPLGRAWVAGYEKCNGDCIIFGPDPFWDCIVISKRGSYIDLRHDIHPEKIVRGEEDEYRFEGLIDPSKYDITPERYSIFAGFKLISVIMLEHLCRIIGDIGEGKTAGIPGVLEDYRFYYHNSSEGRFRDSEGNDVLQVEYSLHPFRSAVLDTDGNEMAAVIPHAFNNRGYAVDRAGYELTANGEHFGEIRKFSDKKGAGFIARTDDGEYRISVFPACRRGNISCNYRIERDGRLMAVIAGSPRLEFAGRGQCRNEIILSYDDDYLVLYAVLEVFILTLNSSFLK